MKPEESTVDLTEASPDTNYLETETGVQGFANGPDKDTVAAMKPEESFGLPEASDKKDTVVQQESRKKESRKKTRRLATSAVIFLLVVALATFMGLYFSKDADDSPEDSESADSSSQIPPSNPPTISPSRAPTNPPTTAESPTSPPTDPPTNPPTFFPTEYTGAAKVCSKVSPVEQGCRVTMGDKANVKRAMLEVINVDWDYSSYPSMGFAFNVTDDVDTDDPWTVLGLLDVDDEEPMLFLPWAGVPDINCSRIMSEDRYIMHDDSQLTFTELEGYPCTEFGKRIIYFFIMEWFYFG
eukprot:scaffold2962_cov126-Cylindrotheca_fusiformis.AAC.15